MKLSLLLLPIALACSDMPPEIPRTACRALAIDKANAAADVQCDGVEWEACPTARDIETELMIDLEHCDGDR
jgi:hypothetical protein